MLIPKLLDNKTKLTIAVAFTLWLALLACSVNVKDRETGNGKVDISTPVGGIHVDENADARDTGLPVYPGARQKPKTHDGDEKNANVNLSAFGFGLKVVAIEYLSDDPPDKVIAYYQGQLKRYGDVVQCHSSGSSFKVDDDVPVVGGKKGYVVGGKIKCNSDDSGKTVELKSGTDDNQHIVAVEPEGKGSDFSIVWVRVRGKEADI
jgi:hypothetical protein